MAGESSASPLEDLYLDGMTQRWRLELGAQEASREKERRKASDDFGSNILEIINS